jgi:hypothetical protein
VVTENGKSTEIKSTPGGKIEVQITDPNNPKSNKQFDAKDLDDLKKKDEAIAKIYEQHSQPPRLPVGAVLPIAPRTPVESARQRLQSIDSQIERMKAQLKDTPGAQESLKGLQTIRDRYEQQLKDLEKTAPATPAAPRPAEPKAAEARAIGGQ